MRSVIVLLLFAIFVGLPGVAEATILPIEGGSGGSYFRTDCAAGQYLVGFSVRAGAWIDAIAPLCAPYLSGTGTFGDWKALASRGGKGGSPEEKYCSGASIGALQFTYTRDGDGRPQFVDDISFSCLDAGGNKVGGECIDSGENCSSGSTWKFAFQEFDCPDGELATGIQGRSGDSLDALGMICGPAPRKIVLGTAKPPNAPPPPPNVLKGNGKVVTLPGGILPPPAKQPGAPPPAAQLPSYALTCLGGGKMQAQATSDGFVRITFAPASQGSAAAPPHKGECAWSDRGFRPGEPQMLVYNGSGGENLAQAAKRGDAFQVHAYNNNQGAMIVTSIDVIEPSRASNPSPTQPPGAAVASFSGNWNSRTDNGGIFAIALAAVPQGIAGTYRAQDGRLGQIAGSVHGNVLDFACVQQGGYAGSGHFVLAADGNSFSGSFRITLYPGQKPTKLDGAWQGVRQ